MYGGAASQQYVVCMLSFVILYDNHAIQTSQTSRTVKFCPPGSPECSSVSTEEPAQTGDCWPGSQVSPGGTFHFSLHPDRAPCK